MKRRSGSPPESAGTSANRGGGSLAATIGKRGFRRWYERQLIEGFAHMITGVFSLIMMCVALEMLEFRSTAAGLLVRCRGCANEWTIA